MQWIELLVVCIPSLEMANSEWWMKLTMIVSHNTVLVWRICLAHNIAIANLVNNAMTLKIQYTAIHVDRKWSTDNGQQALYSSQWPWSRYFSHRVYYYMRCEIVSDSTIECWRWQCRQWVIYASRSPTFDMRYECFGCCGQTYCESKNYTSRRC
jgi:hypothetical protein